MLEQTVVSQLILFLLDFEFQYYEDASYLVGKVASGLLKLLGA